MASTKQRKAARKNVRKAQRAARSKRTIAKLPKSVRTDLGKQAAASRKRGGRAGRALEDRTRTQLYERAKQLGIPGRSKMGKWELITAIRRHG
jgi:Rho termination factor, N-terminal domain